MRGDLNALLHKRKLAGINVRELNNDMNKKQDTSEQCNEGLKMLQNQKIRVLEWLGHLGIVEFIRKELKDSPFEYEEVLSVNLGFGGDDGSNKYQERDIAITEQYQGQVEEMADKLYGFMCHEMREFECIKENIEEYILEHLPAALEL